jgi:glycerate dehydrogenase
MKIVVTDGYTVNSGDLQWDAIKAFGELTVYERTPPHLIEERCREATIVLTNKTPFSRSTLLALPDLKCISVLATGFNVIDTDAAKERNIVVCNVPGYGTASVAQHVFALLLELTNAVGFHSRSVHDGGWHASADWCYTLQPVMELHGKTIGIVGFGNIGQHVAKIAAAFGMRIIYHNHREKESAVGEQVTIETLFRQSDVVSLHCPLTQENKHMVNSSLLRQMKPTAFLINTARGPLVNEEDLAAALNNAVIAGAALDVLEAEPPTSKQLPLIAARNCIVTPHNAWMSREARSRMMDVTAKNIAAFLHGEPVNRVA